MSGSSFEQRRSGVEEYFDLTAAAVWARLSSAEKLGRTRAGVRAGRFVVGDMTDPAFGGFAHLFAMETLIHYQPPDLARCLARFAARIERSIASTYAPRTFLLAVMHGLGCVFLRANRSPAIAPIAPARLARLVGSEPGPRGWRIGRRARVDCGFYISQAVELVRQ